MKKSVLIFGLILGVVLCINMIYTVNLCYSDFDFKSNDVVGYASMVVILSLIFFGVKNYRNKQLNGFITFKEALKTGALIAVIASTMYVVVWLFYYYLFVPDFLDHYIPHVLKETPESEVATKTQEMANFKEMYKNPFFVVLITYAEVLPLGLIVSLVSALILKRKSNNKESI